MVNVMRPLPMRTVCDPACGTGGFFLAAYNYISENYNLTREQKAFLRFKTFAGTDIVDNVVRLLCDESISTRYRWDREPNYNR